ncbi:galectin-4 isoform X3 [Petaurus breviceps papuanus]
MVTHLQVDGDLELQSINFFGGGPALGQMPMTVPAHQGPGPVHMAPPNMEGPPVFNPPVPFFGQIRGGLTPRKTIVIKGLVSPQATSISINFKVAQSQEVALHINPRMPEAVHPLWSRSLQSLCQWSAHLRFCPPTLCLQQGGHSGDQGRRVPVLCADLSPQHGGRAGLGSHCVLVLVFVRALLIFPLICLSVFSFVLSFTGSLTSIQFHKHVLSAFCTPGTFLGLKNTKIQTKLSPVLMKLTFYLEETQISKFKIIWDKNTYDRVVRKEHSAWYTVGT